MSGGSYDYLCYKDADQLFLSQYQRILGEMRDRLSGFGYAADAARETAEVLLVIQQAMTRLDVMSRRLSDVWKAVEWLDSGDWSEEQLVKALASYRGEAANDG